MAKKSKGTKRYATAKSVGQKTGGSKLRRILFTILVLLVVAATVFFLIIRSGDQISIFENAVGSLVTPVQNFFRTATDNVKTFVTNWHNYDTLQADYDKLEFENEQLRMELVNAEEALGENARLKELMDAKDTYDALDPIYAKVIARESGPWFETFSLNRGSNHGVSVGMAVVNGDGLIGRVTEVGLNFSKVICIIDTRSAVACLMQRTRDNGVMRGQITNSADVAECFVYYLPNINSISPGDVVVTSGTDSLYPKGIRIGTVSALSLDAGSEGTYAVVTPSVDFQRIEEVFILRTVIETDTNVLPVIATPEASYQASITPTPRPNATPTPTVEADLINEIWTYPTTTPSSGEDTGDHPLGKLIEDTWAGTN